MSQPAAGRGACGMPALTAKSVRQMASKVPRDLPPDGMASAIHMSGWMPKGIPLTALKIPRNLPPDERA